MDDTRGGAFGTSDGAGLELVGLILDSRLFALQTEHFDLLSLFFENS
jgi:hypothetical protein